MQQPCSRRAVIAAMGSAAAVGAAGCLGLSRGGEVVGMSATAYLPETIRISPGDTVVWENSSTRRHTVTAASQDSLPEGAEFFASGGYDSYEAAETAWQDDFGGGLENGDTFRHTFEVVGAHTYVCIPHVDSGMIGTVVVQE